MNQPVDQPSVKAFRGSILHFLKQPESAFDRASYQYLKDGLLVVTDGHVSQLGAYRELITSLPIDIEITDHSGCLILPGLIDTHLHYPQIDIIASYGEQLLDWLKKYAFPGEGKFRDTEYAGEAADFFLAELYRNGTTTALVMPTVHPQSVDILFEKAAEKNMRLITGKVMMDRNAPEYLLDTPESSYRESLELIDRWHGKQRLSYAVTPRFAITSSPEQLEQAAALMATRPGLTLHTHLSENTAELKTIAGLFPDCSDYLDVYDRYGLVTDQAVFAHCIHLNRREFGRLHDAGAAVAFCPSSNLFIGSGLFDLNQTVHHTIPVGFGSDIGGGTSPSLLKTMADGYKVLQLKQQSLSPLQAFYLATLGGARALNLQDHIGNFHVGKEADFTVLNFDATPLIERRIRLTDSLEERLFVLMILGDDRSVEATYLMGQPVHTRQDS